MGIVGLDIKEHKVFFQNKQAIEIFRGTLPPKDYDAIASVLNIDDCITTNSLNVRRTLPFGNRFLGSTVYRIAEAYLWIYVTDITEKMRLDSIAEAVNTMNNLGYIFSGIRHELGNPINSIKTTMTVCRNNIQVYSKDTIIEYINRVMVDITRVEGLLKDLKNFSMYENPDRKNVHIPSYLENLLAMVARDFSSSSIKIKTSLRPEAELGYFDPRALQHVILNILTNASDALQGRVEPEIAISTCKIGDRIIIKVRDNGCGIPDEQKKNLFKPFTTTKTQGTGLGLVIVKKMLSKMDGTIRIDSIQNVETIATINLPAGRQIA
ncbi:MAG: HAMP domain-containing sensor histidine kinase [Thermodesulfovibrionales bacterium]